MADIVVKLKLDLAQLRKDLEQAKSAIKGAMGGGGEGGGGSAGGASVHRTKMQEIQQQAATLRQTGVANRNAHNLVMHGIGQTTANLRQQGVAARNAHNLTMQATAQTTANLRQQLAALRLQRQNQSSGMFTFAKNIGFAALPATNLSPLSTLFSFRQGMTALNTPFGTGMRRQAGSALGAMGMRGLGGAVAGFGAAGVAAAAGVLTLAAAGMGLALKALMSVVHATTGAFEEAKSIYSKTMQSGGLPTGLVTQRSAVAGAMGVSMEEMDRYANVVAYVSDRFRYSSNTLADSAPVLAGMSIEISALMQELKAFGAEIAYALGPAFSLIIQLTRGVVQVMEFLVKGLNRLLDTIYNGWALLIELIPGGKIVTNAIQDIFRPTPPKPEADTKRLPTSAWEKMGLVIGSGVGVNYARDTAANTKRIAEILSGRGSEKPAFNPGGLPMAFNGA